MAMAATPSRPGDHETEFTRPGVSEDEIEEIKKVFTMMDTQNGRRAPRGQLPGERTACRKAPSSVSTCSRQPEYSETKRRAPETP